nr:Vht1.2 [Starmerella bombicola]
MQIFNRPSWLRSPATETSFKDDQVKHPEIANFKAEDGQSSTDLEFTLDQNDLSSLNRLYRKLDFRIIPALWVLYFLSSYGSAAYGNALTMNSDKGHDIPHYLGLSSHDTSLSTTLDYVGYIVFDLPMNLCFTFVSPKVWLSRIIITIGLVYACIAAVHNAAGIEAIRFFTGLVSAGIWPGLSYYVSSFYPGDRLSSRIGYYYTAAQLSAAVAGLLGACFQLMDGARGYTGYQWNFLIYGVVTVAFGLVLYFWLPNRPKGQRIWPLKPEDIRLHQAHLKICGADDSNGRWTWQDFFKVMLDPRIWPLILMYFGVVGCGIGIENYATTILRNINPNWSSITLSLLSAPIWLFDLGGILIITPFADRYKQNRGIIFSFSTSIIICGLFVCTFAAGGWSRWGGLLLCGFGLGSTVPITMAWGAEIFRKRHGDLGVAMVTALISGLGNTGSVTTTYALYSGWPEDAARGYRDSNMVIVAILGISIIAAASCTLLQYALGDFGEKSLIDVTFLSWFKGRKTLL